MVVTVNQKDLVQLFADTLKVRKVLINFKCDGNQLDIQVLKDFTIEKSLKCTSVDNDHNVIDCTFVATKALQCISEEKEVTIVITKATVVITQDLFSCTLIKEYESRRELPVAVQDLKEAYPRRFKYLASVASSMSRVAKEIQVNESDPVIVGEKFYVKYWNTVFVDGMSYPDACFSINAIKDFVFLLDDKTKFCHIEENDVFLFRTQSYDIWVPIIKYNIHGNEIAAIEKEQAKCRKIAAVTFIDKVAKFKTLAGAFPDAQISLTFGEKAAQASVNINNASFTVGDNIQNYVLTVMVTPGQLELICRLFSEDAEVNILKGGNCICLSVKEKSLLISGIVY